MFNSIEYNIYGIIVKRNIQQKRAKGYKIVVVAPTCDVFVKSLLYNTSCTYS